MQRSGLSLVELLVVVVVLAIVIMLLLPTLAPPNRDPARVICATNLKSQASALAIYAANFNGKFPVLLSTARLSSLTDQTTETRDALANAADQSSGIGLTAIRRWFYCPCNANQNGASLWNPGGGISHWGYVWLNDRGKAGASLPSVFPERTPPLHYLTSFTMPKYASDTMVALDAVVSDTDTGTPNFSPTGVVPSFGTNHLKQFGANVLYADGHVSWEPFERSDIVALKHGGGYLWFPKP